MRGGRPEVVHAGARISGTCASGKSDRHPPGGGGGWHKASVSDCLWGEGGSIEPRGLDSVPSAVESIDRPPPERPSPTLIFRKTTSAPASEAPIPRQAILHTYAFYIKCPGITPAVSGSSGW